MDKNAVLTGAASIFVSTIIVVILEILTENPGLTDIIVFAVTFAVTAATTYFAMLTIITKIKK